MEREFQPPMKSGFTLIEIIITIVIIGIFIAATALILQQVVTGLAFSSDNVKALSLARLEMSKVNNLTYLDATLADGYDNTVTNYDSTAYDLRRQVNIIAGTGNDIKRVVVIVYPTGTTKTITRLTTYVADVTFGPGSGGNTPGGGGTHADSLVVSDGTVSGTLFQGVTLRNTSTDTTITITDITVAFSGQSGIKIKEIYINGAARWDGTKSSGDQLPLSPTFTLSIDTIYSNTARFTFSKNLTSISSIVFTMSDGSVKTYLP